MSPMNDDLPHKRGFGIVAIFVSPLYMYSAYSGAQKLYSVLEKKYPGVFTITYIKQWLSDQDSYSLQKSSLQMYG